VDFNSEMQKIVEKIDHGMACSLIGFDGIAVGSFRKPDEKVDIEMMGAELSGLLNQLRRSSTAQEFGEPDEFFYSSDDIKVVFRIVTHEYFVALVMGPQGLVGKGRYLLKLADAGLKKELL